MRSTIALLALLGTLTMPTLARAADEYDDSQSHPLRVATYLVHPVGVALEWVIFRPFHLLTSSNPDTEYVFGHRPHGENEFSATESESYSSAR